MAASELHVVSMLSKFYVVKLCVDGELYVSQRRAHSTVSDRELELYVVRMVQSWSNVDLVAQARMH